MTEIAKMSRQELLDCISDKKKEIAQKLKNGETEQSFIIGGNSYTIKEWDKLLARFDKVVDDVKEEQSERREKQMQELYEKGSVKKYAFMEKLNGTYAGHVPYSYLARNGIIEYNGVIFCCDEKRNAICLGDMSNKKNVITIPLSDGGSLMVNENNIGDLSKAISMFSTEDQNRILRAISAYNKAKEMQKTIDDEVNSIGEDAETKVFDEEMGAV